MLDNIININCLGIHANDVLFSMVYNLQHRHQYYENTLEKSAVYSATEKKYYIFSNDQKIHGLSFNHLRCTVLLSNL